MPFICTVLLPFPPRSHLYPLHLTAARATDSPPLQLLSGGRTLASLSTRPSFPLVTATLRTPSAPRRMVSSKGCWEGWFYGMIALDETEAGKQASKQAHKKKQSPRSSSPSSTHLLLPLRRGEGKAAQGVHSHHLPLSPPCPRDGNELDVQVGLALVGRRDADAALRGEELRFGGGGGGIVCLSFGPAGG